MHIPSKDQLKKIGKFKRKPWNEFTSSYLLEDQSNLEAFLYSKVLFKFPRKKRDILLKELAGNTNDPDRKLAFQYLEFAFGRADWFQDATLELIKGCSLESILSYFEFILNRMIKTNTDVDGMSYPEEIIHSKHEFLLSVVPTIIHISQRENLPITNKKLLKDGIPSKNMLMVVAQYHSIIRQIIEVMKGVYIPKPISYLDSKYGANASNNFVDKCKYFLQRAPENLDSIEIYRDLNYGLEQIEERNIEESILTLKESGVIKDYSNNEFMHVDMTRNKEYEEVRKIRFITKAIEGIYASVDSRVVWENIEFNIRDIIFLVKKIINLSNLVLSYRQKNNKHVCIYKQSFQNLKTQLRLSDLEIKIFPLLSADLNLDKTGGVGNRPFFNIGEMYYMFSPAANELSYEKVIDKILSMKNVEVFLSNSEKGLLFEDKVIKLFSRASFEVGKIKRNQKKGVPEIDAIVNFDSDTILVIEAKCTIKPEEREEVFSFVENHLSKAANQLLERVEFLNSSPEDARQRLNFSIDHKNIIPIIVTNHSFFSGFKFVYEGGLVIHCIDEVLLRKIVSEGYIPTWEYTGIENNYVPQDRKLNNKADKLEAILDPVLNLYSKARRTIQPLAYGAAIEISKQPYIDRMEQLKRKIDLEGV